MDRINKIIKHSLFEKNIKKLEQLEKNRKFCKHGIEHLMDVARIGQIMLLRSENTNEGLSEEIIYAAALLHDLGRVEQYESGISHEKAGAMLAEKILLDCDFKENEISTIKRAILNHRNKDEKGESSLENILYKADKASRLCFCCSAYDECKWSASERNDTIIF